MEWTTPNRKKAYKSAFQRAKAELARCVRATGAALQNARTFFTASASVTRPAVTRFRWNVCFSEASLAQAGAGTDTVGTGLNIFGRAARVCNENTQ